MAYRYETHLHTCQGSACGKSTGAEHARFYKDMGYKGIIVTDHFFGGNTAAPRTGPWKERVDGFCAGYEDALIQGQKLGLDVFFGWEQNYRGDEYLIYGLDKQWLLNHPEVETWTRREQLEGVHRDGGCVIQAHPFRDRVYIKRVLLGLQFADGIELVNAGNYPYSDAYARLYAQEYGLPVTAGSDNHLSGEGGTTAEKLVGMETDEPLRDIHDFVRRVRKQSGIRPIIPEGRFDIDLAKTPELATFWLDEQERPVPAGRRWLFE